MDLDAEDLEHHLRKKHAALKKACQRKEQQEHLPPSLKIMVCILVLLETPWELIAAVATCKVSLLPEARSDSPWTTEKIKQVAQDGLLLKPSLVEGPLNDELHEVFSAKKMLAECKLAFWIMEQNVKGITMPASTVIEHYIQSWGIADHKPSLTAHLHALGKKQRRKNWLQTFKKKWNLEVGALPHRPDLLPHQITNKVTSNTTVAISFRGRN